MEVNTFSQKKALFEGFSLFSIVVLLFIVALASLSSGAPLLLVMIGFSPTLITIIASIIIYEEAIHTKVVVWFLPFLLAGIFFFLLTSQSFLSYNIKVVSLTGINLFFSIVYLAMFFLLIKLFSGKKKSMLTSNHVVHHHPQPQSIKEYVASIEDKSKALNFVIGRVYNKYHGGSKELREKISINKEWYNEFSEIIAQNEKAEKIEDIKNKNSLISLLYVVNKIQDRLKLVNKSEIEVFGQKHFNLKNLQRTNDGNDLIIEVMKRNDKDPIESYYKGALEFCEALRQKLDAQIKKL